MTIYLPYVSGSPTPLVDVYPYIFGDGSIYWVSHWQGGAYHQCRYEQHYGQSVMYQLKGSPWGAEYEEFYQDGTYICRGTDSSMGGGRFYTLYDDGRDYWSRWCPRFWKPGDVYERNPLVVVRTLDNCRIVQQNYHRTWIRFAAVHDSWPRPGLVEEVIELHWLTQPDQETPEEIYYYGLNLGLIGWQNGRRPEMHSQIERMVYPEEATEIKRQRIRCEMPAREVNGL